jgi:hypothetical protein
MPTKEEYCVLTLGDLKEIADEEKCVLITAKPNELLLDLDAYQLREDETVDGLFIRWRSEHSDVLKVIADKFGDTLPRDHPDLGEIIDPICFEHWLSRNGRLHVRVVLRDRLILTMSEAVALQAALGSDSKREALAIWEFEALQKQDIYEDTRSLFKPKGA